MRSPAILVYVSVICMAIALTMSTTANVICQYLKIQADVNDQTYDLYTVGIFWGGRNDLTANDLENDTFDTKCYTYDHQEFDASWMIARAFAVLSIGFGITTLILAGVFAFGTTSSLETVMVTRYVGLLCVFCALLQGLTLFMYASDEACPPFDDISGGSFTMEVPLSCVGDVGAGLTVGAMGMWLMGSMFLGCALRRVEDDYY